MMGLESKSNIADKSIELNSVTIRSIEDKEMIINNLFIEDECTDNVNRNKLERYRALKYRKVISNISIQINTYDQWRFSLVTRFLHSTIKPQH